MNKKKRYNGIVVPMVTPLTHEHRLDETAVEKIIGKFREQQVMPFMLGTTGEAASLSLSMKKDFIRLMQQLKQPGETWYAGIASNCMDDSVALANYCFEHEVDVVAAHLPSYYSLSAEAMKKYFEELANRIQGPLIIYNIPATTHMSIPLDVIDELSHHPAIVAVKDSERSEERLKQSLTLWRDREDFSYFLGWAAQSAYALSNGADGLIPSTGNLLPQIYSAMLEAVSKNEAAEVLLQQQWSDEFGNLYQAGRSLGESLWALKVLMSELDLCQPFVMPPLQAGSEEEAMKLRLTFRELIKNKQIKQDKEYV
jgi:dihydrodipicolinate synthase/N-acetylneuraminate lyase